MAKKLLIILFLLFSYFCITSNVYAEDNSCTYKEQANLNKLAGSVEVSYDIQKNTDGTYIFKISIYNLTSDLSVTVTNDYDATFFLTIVSEMTNNGTYTFEVNDYTNIIKYSFVVRATTSPCTSDLKKLTLVKPKKNKYHDYNECKLADTEGYTYCTEWITKDITLSESEVLEKIQEQRSYVKRIKTTKCANCSTNVRMSARLEMIMMYKRFIVIGLSIGIALDIIYIYLKVSNIRRSAL
ncbi:MAG: hypothetical protein J1F35_01780 [Erysipelotrichales bacterium]|nr:hypothetical protein [Erysipelotrichales bacterium]